MSDTDLVDRIACEVEARLKKYLPNVDTLWDLNQVAEYLQLNAKYVREKIAPRPDFPKAICIQSVDGRRGQPRYEPPEIRAFARSFKDRN